MITPGARLTLEIDKPAAGGRMLARHAGQVVLVSGTLPGERVVARVERVGKGVAFAETEEVLVASPDRRGGDVDWKCGGNVFAHIAYPRQLALKAQIIRDAFTRIGRMPLHDAPEVLGSPEKGYRMRARLHVQGSRIGFFREGTHQLCDPAATGQLLPPAIAWIGGVQDLLRRSGTDLQGPTATSLEIAEDMPGVARAAHLELHGDGNADRFRGFADGLVGLSISRPDRECPARRILEGTPAITDHIRTRKDDEGSVLALTRDVRAFFQGNRFLLEPLVQRVVALVGEGPVVDLYAGVGLFGLSLAAAGAVNVTVVEGDPISGADLARNAEPFGARVTVHQESVERFLSSAGPLRAARPALADSARATFVVDPPRTGMTREALIGIISQESARIVYVSCDVATLARDARTLVDAGYELTELTGIDLFPNTAHVEAVGVFVR